MMYSYWTASLTLLSPNRVLGGLAILLTLALGLFLLAGLTAQAQTPETIEFAEHTPVTTPVAVFTATDDEDDKAGLAVTWSLQTLDDVFDISEAGVLTFEESPDYENLPAGGGGTNSDEYSVTVRATDSDEGFTDHVIVVQLVNVDEPATLTLSNRQPVDGVGITATLTDEDGAVSSLEWQWARGSSRTGPFTDIEATTSNPTNSGNTSVYTPGPSDIGSYLRVTVTYTDPEGSGKELPEVSARSVLASRSSNTAPVIEDSEGAEITETSITREVDENSAAGTPVGGRILVGNTENDVLTFKLSGADASKFVIDSNGQISVGAGTVLDTEQTSSPNNATFSVTVTVEDGNFTNSSDAAVYSDSITVNITAANVQEDPELDGKTSVEHAENTPIATAVAMYAVTDDEDDSTSTAVDVELSGTDADLFTLTDADADGTWDLAFKAVPDYEAPADAGRDNAYNVTITAEDNSDLTDVLHVVVMVTNEEEDGTVELSTLAPKVGVELTATLTGDEDGPTSRVTWEWERSDASSAADFDADASTVTEIEGATSASYTPVHADAGNFLRATATYTDPQGEDSASQVTAAAVLTTNRAPWFDNPATDDTDESMVDRSVNEGAYTTNTTNTVGAVVTATDPESASLTYELSGDAAPFSIDRATAQISVRAGQTLDTETKDEYVVTVTATDPDGLSATATVTIEITNVPEPPVVTRGGLAIGGPASPSYAEGTPVTTPVATYTLAGPNAASGTLTLGGDDAGDFTFTGGVLSFAAVPDYEAPADADMDNVYEVTLSADDGTYDAMRTVTVTVTNVDEDGTLTLSSATPAIDVPLTATYTDPDGETNVAWQWALEQSDGSYRDIPGATSDSYTPVAADEGFHLRVTVTYDDGHGAGKSLPPMITANPVVAGDPLVVRYDVMPKNGEIDKAEVINAINDYLDEGQDAPSKADVIKLINLYLGDD